MHVVVFYKFIVEKLTTLITCGWHVFESMKLFSMSRTSSGL